MKAVESIAPHTEKKVPKSLVVCTGRIKTATFQELVLNFRKMMEPNTALKLKERKNGKMKDYMAVAGNLGITHMAFLSQTLMHTTLRMGHFPRGPSLYFDVLKYSLMRDVHHSHEKPTTLGGIEYKHAPLVLLDGFEGTDKPTMKDNSKIRQVSMGEKERNLLRVYLQNMFPAIHIPTMRVGDAKRVLLFHLCDETENIYVRHYIVKMNANDSYEKETTVELFKEKLMQGIKEVDEAAVDGAKAQVQKSVVVAEVGPRLTMNLTKIVDGFMDDQKGKVLYARFPYTKEKPDQSDEELYVEQSEDELSEELSEDIEDRVDSMAIKKKKVSFKVPPSKDNLKSKFKTLKDRRSNNGAKEHKANSKKGKESQR